MILCCNFLFLSFLKFGFSIGYPVVTFGFGFKSYVGYRMRQRRQREVSKENEFYMELLQQALPPPPDPPAVPASVPITSSLPEKSNKGIYLFCIFVTYFQYEGINIEFFSQRLALRPMNRTENCPTVWWRMVSL